MRLFLVAGEPSGDRLGAALMAGLKYLVPDVEFHGVGGPLMQAQGMDSLFAMDELSVMGIAEILPKYRALKRRISETASAVLQLAPDALITIDSPDFCLRVARLVRNASDIRTVHYVAPSVWAWRPGRAKKMAQIIDQVLALLPFEPPYMQAAGMRCDFVGHPVACEPVVSEDEKHRFRAEEGLQDVPVILVLPGSRKGEVQRLAPVFGAALAPVIAAHPGARVVIPTVSHLIETVQDAVQDWPGHPLVLDPNGVALDKAITRKNRAFAAADIALAASGTVSMELATARTPMVIAYNLNWLSWKIIAFLARIDTVTIVNLVTGRAAIPEFLGPECQPEPIGAALGELMDDPAAQRVQIAAMDETMIALGQGGEAPGLRAARAVLDGLGVSGSKHSG